jgi:hypothetical protein
MMELVGIEPFQWIENVQLTDSTMSQKARKAQTQFGGTNWYKEPARLLLPNTAQKVRAYMFFRVEHLR